MLTASPLLETYEQLPFKITRGEGEYIYSENGDRYLDLYGGHAVSLLGHCPPTIIAAIEKQIRELFFYSNIAPIHIREYAAEKLAELVPQSLRHIFFCNSGAEANENALKLAIRLTSRERLIAYHGSFHGRSLLASCVTDSPQTHKDLKGWFGNRVTFLEANNSEQLPLITHDVAAVILEPIQSIGGVLTFAQDYLTALRKQCTTTGTILIYDEVQTGMGRTGVPFISCCQETIPDMCTTAKGIASGYPVGALFISDELSQKVRSGDLGSTYGGGPVAMAAVAATVETLINDNMFEHVQALDTAFKDLISLPCVEEVRGKGCLIGIRTKFKAKELSQRLLEKKIITGTCKDPYILRLLPPIILSLTNVNLFRSALEEVCT